MPDSLAFSKEVPDSMVYSKEINELEKKEEAYQRKNILISPELNRGR